MGRIARAVTASYSSRRSIPIPHPAPPTSEDPPIHRLAR